MKAKHDDQRDSLQFSGSLRPCRRPLGGLLPIVLLCLTPILNLIERGSNAKLVNGIFNPLRGQRIRRITLKEVVLLAFVVVVVTGCQRARWQPTLSEPPGSYPMGTNEPAIFRSE